MTSGKASREVREQKAAERRAAVVRAESRRKNSIRLSVALVVVLVVVGFGALIQAQRGGSSKGDPAANPSGAAGTAQQSIFVGKADAPVTVTVYEDFQCPICRDFENENAATLAEGVAAGTVRVDYRPIALLDFASTTKYSTRSLNAAACVQSNDPSKFVAFHSALFENQPPENSAGLTNAKLADLVKKSTGSDLSSCVKDLKYEGWTKRVTDQASKDGISGTPTVRVNGTVLADWTNDNLKKAIAAAAKK